jgi:hypothetical protein
MHSSIRKAVRACIALYAAFLLLLLGWAFQEFSQQNITYSDEWGWVDWGHARADGPRVLLSIVAARLALPVDSVDVPYTQRSRMFGLLMETSATFRLCTADSAKALALSYGIFERVSAEFEAAQGRIFPDGFLSPLQTGDLHGNAISFYAAARGLDVRALKQGATHKDPWNALGIFVRENCAGAETGGHAANMDEITLFYEQIRQQGANPRLLGQVSGILNF